MNFKKAMTCITLSALASTTLLATANNSDLILGSWNCKYAIEQEGMSTNMEMNTHYKKDGTGEGSAVVSLVAPELGLDIAFDLNATTSWYIEGNSIYETITSGTVKSLKPSPYDAMLSDDDLLPIGQQEISEIKELTSSKLVMASEGDEINCTR